MSYVKGGVIKCDNFKIEEYLQPHCTNPMWVDLTGLEVGWLTVIGYAGMQDRLCMWLCQCKCGNYTRISRGRLKHKTKPTRSCGCMPSSLAREKAERLKKAGEKKCVDCKQVKPLREFSTHKTFLDGYHSRCKRCEMERIRLIREGFLKDGEPAEQVCTRCNETKAIRLFSRASNTKTGRNSVCVACTRRRAEERREKNKDKSEYPERYKKTCRYCHQELPLTAFHLKCSSSDGRAARCVECSRQDMRSARASRPEHYRELGRQSRLRNLEQRKANARASYRRTQKKRLEEKAEYRRKHPEKVIASKKESQARMRKLPKWRARAVWYSKKIHCGKRGIEFSLSLEWIREKFENGTCEVTGLPFDFDSARGPYSPSLDRKNPEKGYTEENTQAVIWAYNAAKGRWTAEDVLIMAHCLVERDMENPPCHSVDFADSEQQHDQLPSSRF